MSVNYPCTHGVTRFCRICEDASQAPAASSFAATAGSAAKCEWWTGDKKTGFTTCQNDAEWQHINQTPKGYRTWKLCNHHKRLVLDSYNAKWRAKEEPEWTPVLPPNGEVSHRSGPVAK